MITVEAIGNTVTITAVDSPVLVRAIKEGHNTVIINWLEDSIKRFTNKQKRADEAAFYTAYASLAPEEKTTVNDIVLAAQAASLAEPEVKP